MHYLEAIDQKTKTDYRVKKMFDEMKSDMWAESAESQYADPQLTAMKRKQRQFMINLSVANVINGVREYYRDDHDLAMSTKEYWSDRNSTVMTIKQFEKCKKLGIIKE
jgi:hypothetical protein